MKASRKHRRLAMQALKSVKISTGSRIPVESLKRSKRPRANKRTNPLVPLKMQRLAKRTV